MRVDSKSQILLNSDCLIVQCDNRNKEIFIPPTNHNKNYCKKFNIDYLFYDSGDKSLPPYWWKVQILLDIIKTKKYQIICWMDTDAFIHNFDYDLRDFFSNDQIDFVGCEDICKKAQLARTIGSLIGLDSVSILFQAAVFMVRGNDIGLNIFQDWFNAYNPDKWDRNTHAYIGNGKWAGTDYEQGSFIEYIMPKYGNKIFIHPYYVFHDDKIRYPHPKSWSFHCTMKGMLSHYRKFKV